MILPSAVQCAGRTTPTRSVSWNAPGPLVRAITTTASPMRTAKWPLSPVSRDSSSSIGRRDIDHLDFVERAGGQRKQRPADAVALGILLLAQIAQRHHRLGEMERGGIVQADQLAQFGKPDAFAVTRDLFEDRKGAAERLHADPLPVLGVVVDIALRAAAPAWRSRPCAELAGFSVVFGLVRGLTGFSSPRDGAELYQACARDQQRRPIACVPIAVYHNIN